jgi:hypothetical protein
MQVLLRTLAGIVAVAVVGFALARYGASKATSAPPALNRQASVADFKVNFPSNWRLVPVRTIPFLPLGDVMTLVSPQTAGAELVMGTTQTSTPADLPPRLRAVLPGLGRPQVVTLGGRGFYRYLNLNPQGETISESIYALPTTVGTITAVCSAQSADTPFTASCERVLATIRLTTGDALAITANPGYALELNHILGQLNAVRKSDGPGLRAGSVSARERAASALADAHAQAASAAKQISAVNVSVANQELISALNQNATAYRALARAAARQSPSAYGQAETALATANRSLDAVFVALRELGYQVQ